MDRNNQRIKNRQVELLYAHAPMILVGTCAVAAGMVVGFWNQVPRGLLINWSILFAAVALLRAVLVYRYRIVAHAIPDAGRWGLLFSIGAGVAGVIWGVASVLFYLPSKPEYVLFIACLYAGLVSGATSSSSAHLPAYYLFIIPATLPFAIHNLAQGEAVYSTIGIMIFVYLGASIVFARTGNRVTAESIRLQFENLDLLKAVVEQKEIAETAVRAKNRFLAAASHDLRQPLHALGLLLGVMRGHVTGGEARELLRTATRSTEALNHLFNSLLDVSRLDAGVIEAHPRHFLAAPTLAILERDYNLQAAKKNLAFRVEGRDVCLNTDPVLLERILRNVLTNAVTYTHFGSVVLRCAYVSDDSVSIEVADTGIGIPKKEIDDIFSEYYQIDNPERDRAKGLGLGLAIVRRLCKLTSIAFELQSEIGRGTSFRMLVPAGDRTQVVPARTLHDAIDLSDTVVLVIDDDEDVLKSMHKLLSGWGCRTFLADSEAQAIRAIGRSDAVPDIIFADYRLRDGRTGVDAVRAVYDELNEEVPSVIITGDTSPDRLREAKRSGFRLLHKPVTPAELRAALQQELKSSPVQ